MADPVPKERAPLTFTFQNIGPIEKAELELGDLTIIAGRNNAATTSVVYTLYGFLMTWEDWHGPALRRPATHAADRSRRRHQYQVFETICDLAGEAGIAQVPVRRDTLIRERQEAISALTRRFSEGGLADVFSSPPERFENASIGVRLDTEFPRPDQQVDGTDPEDTRWIRYDGANLSVTARQSASKKPIHSMALRRLLWRQYLRFLFPELPSDPFVLSAERFGISLFYTELDFRKSQLVDLLQKYGDAKGKDDEFPFFLIDERTSRYARPIKDNIDYTRSIFDLRNQKSAVYDERFFNDVKKMMKGYYAASRNAIEFRSAARGDRGFAIPLHLASSSVRGLSDFYFFLRHVARRDHIIIIDEPESHLDTANQILLARLLARLVRGGLKVLLTTHSDYLIKELNNLIMLDSAFRNKAKTVKKLGYAKDDRIAPERIRAYIAENGSVTKCGIDKFGMDMPNFDRTIDDINDVASELAARVTENSVD